MRAVHDLVGEMPRTPTIQEHAAIGDGRSVALVARDGALDWLCWPVFDSPAIFAGLLDPERGGAWRIGPIGPARVTRRYRDDTNVLETRFETPSGVAVLTDLMCVEDATPRPHSSHELLRRVACERGHVEIELVFAPRPAFGRHPPRLQPTGHLGLRCEVGAMLHALHGERPVEVVDQRAVARFVLAAGDAAAFSLTYDDDIAAIPLLGAHACERIEATCRAWRRWLSPLTYDGPDRDVVVRGLLATKLLSFAPSGAVIAAATTSLPERVGADLNWDYRFCWLRDASFTARAFFDLGFHDDAVAFCGWLLHTTRLTRPELRILYDVYGRPPASEEELPELAGYRGSRPVRIRNGASTQLQLDCYGEVLDAATWLHANAGLDREIEKLLADFGGFVLANWRRPDHGIWEERGAPRHRTHSRVLSWVALDRLLQLRARGLARRIDLDAVARSRAEIRDDIVAHAWNPAIASYTDVYGSSTLDASVLLLPWYGFEDARSTRMAATYRAIAQRLCAGPGLYWRNEDGLRVGEGAFGICSAWVVDYLVRAERHAEARAVFDAFVRCANDVGLFGEEVDPATREALGNFPQAYTHVGLLSAALALARRPAQVARAGGAR